MEKTLKSAAHACTMQPLAVREPVSSVQHLAIPPPFEGIPRGAASAVNLRPGVDHSSKSTSNTGTPLRSTSKTPLEDYVVTGQFHSYLSPKLEARPLLEKGGMGVFACEPVDKGELLVLWGGRILAESELDTEISHFTQRVLQIEAGLYMLQPEPLESSDYFNHSCDPNAGFSGQIALVAMREIEAGEEVCFDYSMCDGSPYDEFICSCGSENCRGNITGEDWMRPDLRERYTGYYSPYLQRRINRLDAVEIGKLNLEVSLGV